MSGKVLPVVDLIPNDLPASEVEKIKRVSLRAKWQEAAQIAAKKTYVAEIGKLVPNSDSDSDVDEHEKLLANLDSLMRQMQAAVTLMQTSGLEGQVRKEVVGIHKLFKDYAPRIEAWVKSEILNQAKTAAERDAGGDSRKFVEAFAKEINEKYKVLAHPRRRLDPTTRKVLFALATILTGGVPGLALALGLMYKSRKDTGSIHFLDTRSSRIAKGVQAYVPSKVSPSVAG